MRAFVAIVFVLGLLAGCSVEVVMPGEDVGEPSILNDDKELQKILAGAIDSGDLQVRGNKGARQAFTIDDDELYTGWAKEMHDNGQVASLIQYKSGIRHGFSRAWYEDGGKARDETYHQGKLKTARVFKPNGDKCPMTNFEDGDGVCVTYYGNGKVKSKMRYKDGVQDGDFILYKKDGTEFHKAVEIAEPEEMTIELIGGDRVVVLLGAAYIEPGFTARDKDGADLTPRVKVTGVDKINTLIPGISYPVDYMVSDAEGNVVIATRYVFIVDNRKP
jgi:hypothetical protein